MMRNTKTAAAILNDGKPDTAQNAVRLLCTGKLRTVNALADVGILPVRSARNAYNPRFHVWFFENTPEAAAIIEAGKKAANE